MPLIVKIGYTHLLVKSEAQAAKILSAVIGCIKLEHHWRGHTDQYWPDEEHPSEFSLITIKASQLHPSDPAKIIPAPINRGLQIKDRHA